MKLTCAVLMLLATSFVSAQTPAVGTRLPLPAVIRMERRMFGSP
jgi:hypothetical protein